MPLPSLANTFVMYVSLLECVTQQDLPSDLINILSGHSDVVCSLKRAHELQSIPDQRKEEEVSILYVDPTFPPPKTLGLHWDRALFHRGLDPERD